MFRSIGHDREGKVISQSFKIYGQEGWRGMLTEEDKRERRNMVNSRLGCCWKAAERRGKFVASVVGCNQGAVVAASSGLACRYLRLWIGRQTSQLMSPDPPAVI